MKSRNNHSVSSVRQAVLAGIITLAGSAAAHAAAPEAPFIDWVDATEVVNENNDYVAVDMGWSRHDFEEVSSVQYRVDGKPVMSRDVSEGQTQGEASFFVDEEGEFEVSVALCNVDGCTETAGASISVSDGHGVEVTYAEHPVSDQASTQDNFAVESTQDSILLPQTSGFEVMGSGLASKLASEVGKAALKGVAKEGGGMAFRAVMNVLGLGDDGIGAQLSELQSSINALNSKIGKLTTAIEDLQDTTAWQGFLNQHKDANKQVNAIYTSFASIMGWLSYGVDPDTAGWTNARKNIDDAISELAGSYLNPGQGIVDMRDGSIYQLMNAVPQRVASVESYWTIIDEYRDYYRAAIAVGFLALDLIEDNYDTTGTTRVMADNALKAGQNAVLGMYAYGVAPKRPISGVEVLDFVQLRSETKGYAAAEYAVLDDSATMQVAGTAFTAWIKDVASKYRPDHHDGMTLEEFFIESNVPTTYFLDNANGWEKTGWELRKVKDAVPHMEQAPVWQVRPRIGQISGNSWVEKYVGLCATNPALCKGSTTDSFSVWYNEDSGGSAKARQEIHDKISARKSAVRSNGGFALTGSFPVPQGDFAESHYASIDLTDKLNLAGRATDFDEDAIWTTAFGDDSVSLAAGHLPGADYGSDCLGLQDKIINILEAGDYQLKWLKNGNLVLRNSEPGNLWAAGTYNRSDRLCWKANGNLVIKSGSEVLWSSDTADSALGGYGGRELKLFPDGTLQIVNELEDVVWQVGPFE